MCFVVHCRKRCPQLRGIGSRMVIDSTPPGFSTRTHSCKKVGHWLEWRKSGIEVLEMRSMLESGKGRMGMCVHWMDDILGQGVIKGEVKLGRSEGERQ